MAALPLSSNAEPAHAAETFRFARGADVPFTNNRAERDIRMGKVKQKVSGCFRTLRHAEAHCRIFSHLQAMGLQGYNPLAAIQIALNGNTAKKTRLIRGRGRVVTNRATAFRS